MLRYSHLALLVICLLSLVIGLSFSTQSAQASPGATRTVPVQQLDTSGAGPGAQGTVAVLPPPRQKGPLRLRRVQPGVQLRGSQPRAKSNLPTASGHWDPNIGNPGMDGEVYTLALSDAGLYAGGCFFDAGGVPATYMAKWDGTRWSAVPGTRGNDYDCFNEGVDALAAKGRDLYVGGWFHWPQPDGRTFTSLAKWDGEKWSGLGSGVNGPVYALAISGDRLYIGGNFDTAGGVKVKNIAMWDMKARRWSAVGGGVDDWVTVLALDGQDLYAGGYFVRAFGGPPTQSVNWITVNGIAKWNGKHWSRLGSGLAITNNPYRYVFAIAVSPSRVYVGGSFDTAGGVRAINIAEWIKASGRWASLGSGQANGVHYTNATDGWVFGLAIRGKTLYVVGDFEWAGCAEGPIAQWDISRREWSDFEGGYVDASWLLGWIDAIAVNGRNIYLGGYFDMVGNWDQSLNSNFIALWQRPS